LVFHITGRTDHEGLREQVDDVTRRLEKNVQSGVSWIYSSPHITQVFKSKGMRWAAHVARGMNNRNLGERVHLE
jgi:hypothetical protein